MPPNARRRPFNIMEGGKLNMSLDAIIEKESRGGRRVTRPSGATAMDTGSGRQPRNGVRKAGARKQPARQAAARQTSGRTLRPRRRAQGRSEDDEVVEEGLKSGVFIKVGGQSQTKSVAGKIAHDARDGRPPALLAKGSASLNQAIKAVAVARQYLQEDKADLTCQPAFRDGKQMASLALYLAKRRPISFPTTDVIELTVGRDSNPHTVAGAIAAKVREDVPVALTSIGEHAATIAMRAICSCRLYLEEDKCDIKALIEFESVVKGDRGDKLNALRFNILVEDV